MTGPLIEFNIRQVYPLDSAVSAVRYEVQTSIAGPLTSFTGPFRYRETCVAQVRSSSLYTHTSITGESPTTGSFDSWLSDNFRSAATVDLDGFYNRAIMLAKAYFANSFTGNQVIKGFTGSARLPGPGVTGSYYREADGV